MTLNVYFVFKFVLGLACAIVHVMGLRVLAFGQNCSEICRAAHYIVICSPETPISGDVSFMRLFTGVP